MSNFKDDLDENYSGNGQDIYNNFLYVNNSISGYTYYSFTNMINRLTILKNVTGFTNVNDQLINIAIEVTNINNAVTNDIQMYNTIIPGLNNIIIPSFSSFTYTSDNKKFYNDSKNYLTQFYNEFTIYSNKLNTINNSLSSIATSIIKMEDITTSGITNSGITGTTYLNDLHIEATNTLNNIVLPDDILNKLLYQNNKDKITFIEKYLNFN